MNQTAHETAKSKTRRTAKMASVLGPYENNKTWRVILLQGDLRVSKTFATVEEAQSFRVALSAALLEAAPIPIAEAIEEFLAHKRRQGLKPSSLTSWTDRLCRVLPQQEALTDITPQRAQQFYDALVETCAAATHRSRLRYLRAFFGWAVERGYLTANPFTAVKPVGKVRAGKRQLRVDEARILLAYLFSQADAGDERCLGLLLQLMMGLRSGEVIMLKARDVDNGGALLCVAMGEEGGKTANAGRSLKVDEARLRSLLVRQKQGRVAEGPLFSMCFTDQLWDCLQRICDQLKIPRVCPHSLRGLCATLAVSRGATAGAVAKALGHGNEEITRRHYIAPGSIEAAGIRRVSALLTQADAQPQGSVPAVSTAVELLSSLAPEQIAQVLAAVQERREVGESPPYRSSVEPTGACAPPDHGLLTNE